jgi:putative endonuclease
MVDWKRAQAVAAGPPVRLGHRATGDTGEARALAYLQQQGLKLVERNYRVARGPSRRAGEVDLILRDRDGTLVFVEVRVRASRQAGGAAASVTPAKQQRLAYAAQHYLMRLASPPACRFDVVAIDGTQLQWLRAAFDLS